jgi:ABC-2 type transport system ATP-binding protein
VLRLSGIRKTFGATVAVDGLSLEVKPGEVFGLLGPNGAGKSTTINIAVGLLRPDSGSVLVSAPDGSSPGPPTDPAHRARIGVAPQAIALYEEMTGAENLAFFGRLHGLASDALADRVSRLLDLVGLADRRRDLVRQYSGGMKRRLNLAAALLHDPPLLLLDEPTAGVDPQSRSALLDLVRSLRDQGRTIVYTTHYMEEAQRVCDRVGIIDHGKLLALDTVEGLISRFGGRSTVTVDCALDGEPGFTRKQVPTDNPVAELAHLLQDKSVRAVHVERPDLEAVFLSLTGRSLRD